MPLQAVKTAATPLAERFTLVVISHDRNAFLRRTLEYYRTFTGRLLVLDSSSEADPALVKDYPGIDYHHLANLSYQGLQEKLAYGSSVVTTPFMAFAADDDFMLHDAISQCVEFLEANPDYGVCHGYGMMYLCRATEVLYFRRDLKVQEDYGSESAQQRVMEFMGQFLPPFYAVTRTELLRNWHQSMPSGVSFEWQEIGHSFYLLACAKARILDIPYIIRELNYGGSDHSTNVLTVLLPQDVKAREERERFAAFLAGLPTGLSGLEQPQAVQIALDSFAAMGDCLIHGRSLKLTRIFRSQWSPVELKPLRTFDPQQFVEMPFYNAALFDRLTEIEWLMHTMPAGRQQLLELEGVLLREQALLRHYPDDTPQSVRARLWQALQLSVFNREVVERLLQMLDGSEAPEETRLGENLERWAQRLQHSGAGNRKALFDDMFSGRLLKWLDARVPDAQQLEQANSLIQRDGPLVEILLLNLNNDSDALQATFDSLVSSGFRHFRVVVLMTAELPAVTSRHNTVHFVRVASGFHVERLNEVVAESDADWLLLADAGDEFTASGLLRAALELRGASGCRAVALDEIHRQEDGALRDVFRPGFNLDLLLGVPALMARHWLIGRETFLEVGGYSGEFPQALEFDLLLRIIENGGMAGLAHLAEPLLICQAPVQHTEEQYNQALARHLEVRGYSAQVASLESGALQIDYRHADRPLVSIILRSQDNFEALQLCLISVLQRTRYHHHEIIIADNHSQDPRLLEWLAQLEATGKRVRVLRHDEPVGKSVLLNQAAAQAGGEYLLFLDSVGQVVTANWVEILLNQAQRPEVGVVAGKLVSDTGACTRSGLILGYANGIGSALVDESKKAAGYMQRLLVEQNCSAVSDACMMVRKSLFDDAGGFDEGLFGEHMADVDLCLTVGEVGYLIVWTPQAQVLHDGQLLVAEDEIQALRSKWPLPMEQDRAYNPNHRPSGKAFSLGTAQKVDWDSLLA